MATQESFCFVDPKALFGSCTIIPSVEMNDGARLNSLVRLVLVITLLLLIFQVREWYLFLIGGLLIILFLWFLSSTPASGVEYFGCQRPPEIRNFLEYREDVDTLYEGHKEQSVKGTQRNHIMNLVPNNL